MKIQHNFEGNTLTITDEGFDSPHVWLNIQIEDIDERASMDILLDDLMPMIIAFDAKRARLIVEKE